MTREDDRPALTCTCGRALRIEQGDGRLFVACRCGVALDIRPRGQRTPPGSRVAEPACYVCQGSGVVDGRKIVAQKIATTAEKSVRFWFAVVQPVGGL